MQTLYFEKISRFDRAAEPVAVSIPFARTAFSTTKNCHRCAGWPQLLMSWKR
jgi:hypothetical protein